MSVEAKARTWNFLVSVFWIAVVIGAFLVLPKAWPWYKSYAGWGKQTSVEQVRNDELDKLAATSPEARAIVEHYRGSRQQLANSQLDREAALVDHEVSRVNLDAGEIGDRIANYSVRAVVSAAVVYDDRHNPIEGKIAKPGDVVRYYPGASRTFPGDLTTYCWVALPPYKEESLCWLARDAVSNEPLENQAPRWEAVPKEESQVLEKWAVEVAPGQETPKLAFAIREQIQYSLGFADSCGLSWNLNGEGWREVPTEKLPHIKGSATVQFRLSGLAPSKQVVVLTIRAAE